MVKTKFSMTFPFVSIIIPVYNVSHYLHECLDSVLNQSFTNWEAICIDDGSTDGSGVILDDYADKDKRIHVIHQKNVGSSAARNIGLDNAIGEWIWFVDSDDTIEQFALEKFSLNKIKADVNFFGMRIRYNDGFVEEKHPPLTGICHLDSDVDKLINNLYSGPLGDIFGWTWDKFIRREIIEKYKIRFDVSISFYEDEVFTIKIIEECQTIAAVPDVFYNYRIINNGLTSKGIPDQLILAIAFISAGGHFNRNSICRLIDIRVTVLLRSYIHKCHSLKAAKLLLNTKKELKHRIEWMGEYNHLLLLLFKMPISLAGYLLVAFHVIKK